MSKRRRARIMQDWLLLCPQLFLYLFFTIVPLVVGLPILFTDRSSFVDPEWNYIGLDNFTRLFRDEMIARDYWPALSRTVRFTILNYLTVYVFGLSLALLMYEVGFKGGFFSVIYLPMMLSGLAVGFMALVLFSESTGSVNLLLLKLGWIEKPVNIKMEQGTTIILPLMVGWQYAGYNMAIFLSGLLSIPKETIEAATVDGASYWQRLLWIYFPQMIPSFIIATTFCLIGSFQLLDHLVALGGLYQNKAADFLSIVILKYGLSSNRLALGMVLSVETFFPLIIIAILLQYLQRRLSYER
jgi:ABC-type sugar transport system permease subunit